MAFDSKETIALLDEVLVALETSRATTKAALIAATEARDALEPLKAENSRISAAVNSLQTQVDLWTAQDAAEDAALARVKAFLDDKAPGVPVGTEPTGGPEVPQEDLTQGDDLPVGLPPATTPVDVPTVDGVDLTSNPEIPGGVDPIDPPVETDPALVDGPTETLLDPIEPEQSDLDANDQGEKDL